MAPRLAPAAAVISRTEVPSKPWVAKSCRAAVMMRAGVSFVLFIRLYEIPPRRHFRNRLHTRRMASRRAHDHTAELRLLIPGFRAMTKRFRVATSLLSVLVLATTLPAQQQTKQRLTSVEEAVAAGGALAGRAGPRSVNWIDAGERFAYTIINPQTRREEIKRYDPATLKEDLLLDTRELVLPGQTEPMQYRSFQWARDSRNLHFQTNFRPIFRRSGLADFYLYSIADKSLLNVAKDARTAQLSPDGRMAGLERGGDMYVYDLATKQERRLTTGGSDSIFNGAFDWVYEEEFGLAQ